MLKLKDLMNSEVISVSPDLTLRELLEVFTELEVSGAPVVTGGQVVGVISMTDVFDLREDSGELTLRPGVDEPDAQSRKRSSSHDSWDPSEEALDWARAASSRDLDLLDQYTVADVMTREVLSQPSHTAVKKAAHHMLGLGISRILVIDEGELQGIVTTTDIVRAVAEGKLKS
jgi:CBS domain-containing protein